MEPCTHRASTSFGVLHCSHPNIWSPGNVVYAQICNSCRFCDHGVRTVEPRRLDNVPRGIGDTFSDALKIIGITDKPGCPCPKRRSWLNQHISYERLPTLAREGPRWLHWTLKTLCHALGIKTGLEPQRVLFRFPHGFGDAVQFTVVLRHLRWKYPQHTFDVVTKPGTASMFRGLAERAIEQPTADAIWAYQPDEHYDHAVNIDWWEPDGCYTDSPATKAEKCLREAFGIEPQLELCRYKIEPTADELALVDDWLGNHGEDNRTRKWYNGTPGFVLLHYQGTTAKQNKNLDESIARAAVKQARRYGCAVFVLDWDNRSCFARGKCKEGGNVIDRTSSLWRGNEYGDGAMLAALASRARLCIGIDSGPGHIFGATDADTLIVWHKHHPLNYYGLSPNVVHVLPQNHQAYIRGDADAGARFFRKHYRHYTCERHMREELPALVWRALCGEQYESPIYEGGPTATYTRWPDIAAKAKRSTELFHGVRIRRRLRSGDAMIVDDVVRDDCYGVRDTFPKGKIYVIDIGAHIGAFAWKVKKERPEAQIVVVEPVRANWACLRANAPRAHPYPMACTYESERVRVVSTVRRGSKNTGGSRVEAGDEVDAVTLDDIWLDVNLGECWPRIDVLKLDCEGSELSILANAKCIDRIGMIVGEWHDNRAEIEAIIAERFAGWTYEVLRDKEPNGLFRLTSPVHYSGA